MFSLTWSLCSMAIPTPTSVSPPLSSSGLFSKISSGSSSSPLHRQFPSTSQTPVSVAFTLQDQAQAAGLNLPDPGGWSDHLSPFSDHQIYILQQTNLYSSSHLNINQRVEARNTDTSRITKYWLTEDLYFKVNQPLQLKSLLKHKSKSRSKKYRYITKYWSRMFKNRF